MTSSQASLISERESVALFLHVNNCCVNQIFFIDYDLVTQHFITVLLSFILTMCCSSSQL